MNLRRGIALGALVVVLVVAGVAVRWWMRGNARQAVETDRAALVRCVLGAPLAAGEGASARVHRIALGDPPGDWPSRCTRYLTSLETNLDAAGEKGDAAELRSKWKNGVNVEQAFAEPWTLDALFAAPAAASAPGDVPAAPAPPSLPDEHTPVLCEQATLAKVSSDAMPGRALHVVLSPATYCAFDEKLASAECTSLTKRTHASFQSFQLWPPTEDGAESLVSDFIQRFGRVQRFFGAKTGTLFDAGGPSRALWAFGYADGSLLTLGPSDDPDRDGYDLLLWHGKEHEKPYTVDLTSSRIVLLGDRVLWVSHPEDTDHLMWAPLSRDPLGLGKPQDLGEIHLDPTDFEACTTEHSLAVALVRGADSRVRFFSSSGVTKAFEAKFSSDASVVNRSRACSKYALVTSRVVTRARQRSATDTMGFIVQYARCSEDGCKSHEVDLDKALANDPDDARPAGDDPHVVASGGLGDNLFIAWVSRARGVRARIAAPDAIASAKDIVVYDDGVSGGRLAQPGTVRQMDFLPRRDAGVLLLGLLNDRVTALRVGLDSKITPVERK